MRNDLFHLLFKYGKCKKESFILSGVYNTERQHCVQCCIVNEVFMSLEHFCFHFTISIELTGMQ